MQNNMQETGIVFGIVILSRLLGIVAYRYNPITRGTLVPPIIWSAHLRKSDKRVLGFPAKDDSYCNAILLLWIAIAYNRLPVT
jgi:hypothetical protein